MAQLLQVHQLGIKMIKVTCVITLYLQVFDQYLNFITLENHFFTVRHQNRDAISYHGKLNKTLVLCFVLNVYILAQTENYLKRVIYSNLTIC